MSDQFLTPDQLRAEVDDRTARRRMAAAAVWREIAAEVRASINEELVRAVDSGDVIRLVPRRALASMLRSALTRAGCPETDPLHYEVYVLVREELSAAGYQFTQDGEMCL